MYFQPSSTTPVSGAQLRVRLASSASKYTGRDGHGSPRMAGRSERPSTGRRRDAQQVEQGRERRPSARRMRPTRSDRIDRPGHDQRHAHRRLVGEEPVRLFAVFAQRLAMVGGHDDQRGVEQPRLAQPIEEPAERGVREGDLGVVRVRPARLVGRRAYGACGSNRWTHANHGWLAAAGVDVDPVAATRVTRSAVRSAKANVTGPVSLPTARRRRRRSRAFRPNRASSTNAPTNAPVR